MHVRVAGGEWVDVPVQVLFHADGGGSVHESTSVSSYIGFGALIFVGLESLH